MSPGARRPIEALNRTRGRSLASNVLVADSHITRLIGLIGTNSDQFGEGYGLWIRPCRGIHTVFMRFAIDAAYLDKEGHVVHMETRLKPWRIGATRWRSSSVLELPAGSLQRSGTQVGDVIEFLER